MGILLGERSKPTFRQSRSQLELLVMERTAELQNLSQRLLRVQDDERRRVARDLHDSTGQTLTALKISVAVLQRKLAKDPQTSEELSGIAKLVDEALQDIRTTSYLLHPPLLDESGFTSAARWYVEGFANRSGMTVHLDFAPEMSRLPAPIEIALFRVLQEGLTNVHRHSASSQVDIGFRREEGTAMLVLRDYGRGIPPERLNALRSSVRSSGVGLAGMRERLNDLQGRLEIEPANPGTTLKATVPVWDAVDHDSRDASISLVSSPVPPYRIHPDAARNARLA